ncbi:Gfo/Idh/MocA family oxidoreductase [Streptomyces bluensis]|uniref:Gfo/Idh/MocA family oxidoreductase n=1 Tax=Streptomyces bluensis TaxID=33897 RepID=A0ABW6UI03_9ACTN
MRRRAHADRVELVAAVDIDKGRLDTFQATAGAFGMRPRGFDDLEAMLGAIRPDLVLNGTPPSLHRAQAVTALRAGAWVLCEKPLCLSLAEYDEIAIAEEEAEGYVSVVLQHRYGLHRSPVARPEELTEASDGEARGVSPFSNSFDLGVWARQRGSEVFDDEAVVLDPDALASYWERQLDWIDSGAAPSAEHIIETTDVTLDQVDVVTGRSGMAFIPAGAFIAYQSAAPDFDYDLANWPSDATTRPGFQYLKPTMYWSAASTSRHPPEAALLIDFLTNGPRVGEIFGLDRGEPANPAFREALAPGLDDTGREALVFSKAMAEEVGEPASITPSGGSDMDALFKRYTQDVLLGEASPREAAEGFIGELRDNVTAAS